MVSFEKYCSSDQYEALQVIASAPASGPPVLIAGPFGTGKTRVLALAAHYFLQESVSKGKRFAILVCTHQQTSADAYLTMYDNLTKTKEDITIVRLMPKHSSRKTKYAKSVPNFQKEMERNSFRSRQRYLIITTCLTAKHIADVLPQRFFTHIFLDEGAQMREPEAVAPLCMASKNTKLVIAGDRFQVGPAILVLGEEPQKYGLSVSLLERLYDLYQELGDVAKPYCTHLSTNFRCHSAIVSLARQVAYKSPLKSNVPDLTTHPDARFPLRFVCTSLDCNIKETKHSTDEVEVKVALKEASRFFMKWPDNWGKKDLRQICFLSPCRGQVTVARNTKHDLPPQVKNVQKLPTYLIQGREFRALFISTSEPTTPEGETRDSTKSISDPAVFITAITRARSLVVAVGNPFMLLRREEHMVALEKYKDRGHCWSLFLKACIDNNTLVFDGNPAALALLKERVSHLCGSKSFEGLGRIEIPPLVNIVPGTPTKPTATVQSTEEETQTESHVFKDYVVKEELGKGGFGVVCHVQSKTDKNDYALKIVRLRDKPEKVMREVEALARLNHPNIVRYYHSWKEQAPPNWQDVPPWKHLPSSDSASYPSERLTGESERLTGESESQAGAPEASYTLSPNTSSHSSGRAAAEDSDSNVTFHDSSSGTQFLNPGRAVRLDPLPPVCLCIKTELCDKETLKTWLTKNKDGRKRVEITNWFVELLEGVKFIHSQRLMHRDLKPSNIFFSLETNASARKIKIGDFGLVTTSQVALGEAAPPKSNYVGTSFYISPEQTEKRHYGKEVDIYALGVIYFEMNYPFGTESERCKVLGTLRNKGSVPTTFENNLPHEATIIQWMLTEDPSQRPSAETIASNPRKKKLVRILKRSKDTVPQL